MIYCDQDDIVARITLDLLIQMSDDSVPPANVGTVVLGAIIAEVGEIIDGHLRDRYILPLSPIPTLLTSIACNLVIYKLWARRPETHGEAPKSVVAEHKDALAMLRQIQAGKLTLGITDSPIPEPREAEFLTNKTSFDREFSHARLRRY
jgi:phage gp36-like protein